MAMLRIKGAAKTLQDYQGLAEAFHDNHGADIDSKSALNTSGLQTQSDCR